LLFRLGSPYRVYHLRPRKHPRDRETDRALACTTEVIHMDETYNNGPTRRPASLFRPLRPAAPAFADPSDQRS
jgi:hypothetical protein